MLITDYIVGRDEGGKPLYLVVRDVLPGDCLSGRASLVRKLARSDLIQEFVSDDDWCEWIKFPDLPPDVVELLDSGVTLMIIDSSDYMEVPVVLTESDNSDLMYTSEVMRR